MCRSIKFFLLIFLASCSTEDIPRREKILVHKTVEDEFLDSRLQSFSKKKNSVLLLLPMSKNNEALGRSILNSCVLAAIDSKDIDFYVIDTMDPSVEKFRIFDSFKNKNLKAIIGPIFFKEARQYGVAFPNIPMLTFSNNININSDHIFPCGLSLQDEFRSLVAYANSRGIDSFLIMLPDGKLGDQIVEIVENELKQNGLEEGDNLEIMRYTDISRKNATKYAKNSNKKAVFVIDPILTISKLENKQVFTLTSVALNNKEAWTGAIVAFLENDEQKAFSDKYYAAFGMYPTIFDMIGYDLMMVVKNAINSETSVIGGEYYGCLGNFSINKKSGLKRNLEPMVIK